MEKLLNLLLNNSQDTIILLDPDFRIRNVYGATEAVIGFSEDELKDQLILDYIDPADHSMVLKHFNSAISSQNEIFKIRWKQRHKDGKWNIMDVSIMNCSHLDDISGVILHINNKTEQSRKQDILAKRYRSLFEKMRDGFVIVNPDGKILEFNDIYRNMLGYSDAELLALRYQDITLEKWHDYERDIIKNQVLTRGYSDLYEKEYIKKNGESIPIEIRTYLIKEAEETKFWGIVRDISGRKASEKIITSSERKYRAIFEGANDAIFTIQAGIINDCNSKAYEMYACERDDFINVSVKKMVERFSPQYQPDGSISKKAVTGIVSSAEAGMPQFFTWQHITGDGNVFYAEISINRIDIDNETILLAIIRDVTERVESQKALRESNENLRITLNSIGDGVIATDEKGLVMRMNPVAEKLTGWKISEARGYPFNEVFVIKNSAPQAPLQSPIQKVLETGRMSDLDEETILLSANGKEYEIGDSSAPLFDNNDNILGAVLVFRDVTEKNRLQREALQNAVNFRTIFETSPSSIVIQRSSDSSYVMANHAFIKHTGHSREDEVIGKLPVELGIKVLGNPGIFASITEELKTSGSIQNKVIKLLTKDGIERDMLFSSKLFDFNGEPCILSVSNDITELSRLQQQLNQAHKMDAIGNLAGGVAHDFNNMLGGIFGATELLMMTKDGKKQKKYIDMIKSAAKRASELTNKLLLFSRKESIDFNYVDVHLAVDEAANLLKRTLDKKINISLQLNAEEHMITGDMSLLMNVFLNLGINAGHAMPDGGTLIFTSRNVELDKTYCRIDSFDIAPGKYILVEVRDTGTGIPGEHLDKIFEPFFTTKAVGEGTGLGLSAVYGAIKQHRGSISVYSELDKGTVINIYLPSGTGKEQTEATSRKLIHGSGCILVVDDEEIMRITAREILEYLGYEVELASNGREGVDVYKKNQSKIRAVLLDMVMPVMNGRECFNELKKINKDVRVIMTSGLAIDDDLRGMQANGLKGSICKPFQTLDLSNALAKALYDNI